MISKPATVLLSAVYILIAVGIVMTYSSSAVYAEKVYGNAQYFLIRQCIFVGIGTGVLFLCSAMPFLFWKQHSRLLILISIALLLLVLIPGVGHVAGGARRWLRISWVNFQPAEFAKVAVCIYLADYLARRAKKVRKGGLSIFVPPLILVGIICVLILLQPDLGSCAFILLLSALLLFLAGLQLRYVVAASVAFLPVFYFLIIQVPYRLNRVSAYLNPWEDPRGSGFQMIQSLLAFGLGGIKGVGLGNSAQKLFYLPSSYNDFILAIIGEEFGLFGLLGIISLFAIIFLCGIRIARRTDDFFAKILAIALTLSVVLQALINMMVATGLLPTKGLSLPFISYGGTSVVVNLLSVGILLSVDQRIKRPV